MSEIRPHEFLPDGEVSEWDGTPACGVCPLRASNAIHEVPLQPPDVLEVERRRVGERGNE